MEGEHFGDDTFGEDVEEAFRIVTELAELDESGVARDLAVLIQRARTWRLKHVSVVD